MDVSYCDSTATILFNSLVPSVRHFIQRRRRRVRVLGRRSEAARLRRLPTRFQPLKESGRVTLLGAGGRQRFRAVVSFEAAFHGQSAGVVEGGGRAAQAVARVVQIAGDPVVFRDHASRGLNESADSLNRL